MFVTQASLDLQVLMEGAVPTSSQKKKLAQPAAEVES
jgi:hypothetical protein